MVDYSKLSDSDLIALKEGRTKDVSDEGLLIASGKEPTKQKTQYSKPEQYFGAMMSGIPFGQDIAAAAGAAVYGGSAPEGTPFSEKQALAKRIIEEAGNQGFEQMPVISTIGSLSSGLPLGAIIPQGAFQAPSIAGRLGKGIATGATLGGAYGAGQGQGNERLSNAIEQSIYGGAIGGAGAIAGDIIGAGWRGGRSLAKKAAALFDRVGRAEPNITIKTGQLPQGLTTTVAPEPISLTKDIIPLTQGQAQQSARLQALEYGAQGGAFGDEAQKLALEARDLQNQAAKKALSGLSGAEIGADTGLQAATDLKTTLSQSYKAARARTSAAYGAVADLSAENQLKIAGDFVKESVIPQLDDFSKNGFNGRGFDLGSPKMSNAKRLYDQISKFKKIEGIKAIDFFRMEDWRGRVSQGIAEAERGSPEKAFLSGLLDRYDSAMRQLPKEAILNGDDAIISAMEKARFTRRQQGVLFEKSKIIKDIVQSEDMTNEQFYNVLSSMGNKSGTYVRDILRTAATEPEKQAALRDQIKKSIVGSILSKSLSAETAGTMPEVGQIEKMISFDKLATNLDRLIKNKTLFNQVFNTPEDRDAVIKLYNSASLIKSVKSGSKNYSNTAYTLFNFMKSASPTMASANIFGVGVGPALKAAGEAGAVNELNQALAPVLKGVVTENTGTLTNFGEKYGRSVMTSGLVNIGTKKKEK